MNSNKKITAQSQVIGTVLMILIVIALIVIIMGVVIPFVQNQLAKSKCIDVVDQVKIYPMYTCYNLTSNDVFVQVHIGENRDKLDGFEIVLGGASSSSFQITDFVVINRVRMYDGSTTLTLPQKITERTYVINETSTKPESISVYPILKGGKICEPPDTLNSVDFCINS